MKITVAFLLTIMMLFAYAFGGVLSSDSDVKYIFYTMSDTGSQFSDTKLFSDTGVQYFSYSPSDTDNRISDRYFETVINDMEKVMRHEYVEGIKKEWVKCEKRIALLSNDKRYEQYKKKIGDIKEGKIKGKPEEIKAEIDSYFKMMYDTDVYKIEYKCMSKSDSDDGLLVIVIGQLNSFLNIKLIKNATSINNIEQAKNFLKKHIKEEVSNSPDLVFKDGGIIDKNYDDNYNVSKPSSKIIITGYGLGKIYMKETAMLSIEYLIK